ncbi:MULTISPECIES: hypothetical protein [Nocardia]|uniref:Uncharacterized protein n=1 Tax=Nocardia nova TaxID=37330 RepID=A0A2T2Z8A5_9NOCA|nr:MULTISPECIES: hypothetical protein [Nocardia]PSR63990.1 hypothetical protein C8259_09075 [Nocardia nova]
MSAQEYLDARNAGRAAFDRGEPTTANPYAAAARAGLSYRDIVVDGADIAEANPKATRLARLWLAGWQSGRDADESSRS